MPHLFVTDRVRRLKADLSDFLDTHVYPFEQEWLPLPFSELEPHLRSLQPLVEALGAWNLYMPESLGGPGLSLTEIAQIVELLGRTPYGLYLCNCQAPDAGNIELLQHYADQRINDQYLLPLLRGEMRSCFAMTEPDLAGSNPVRLGTMARREDDEYIIDGHKWFTTGADGAAFAIVMAITNPDAENAYERASMIIVPTDADGFNMVRNIPIMGHAGAGWLGHSEIKFEGLRVPVRNRLGPEGGGFRLAQERLGPGRIHHCMRWIGIAERCFEMMCQRAATRELSPGKTLGHQQMVQQWIAESRAQIDACRFSVLHTAHRMDTQGAKAARDEVSAIKFLASDMLLTVIDRAIQTHGALGVTDDTILSWFYREERASRIYDGTDETHKSSLARRILKRYRNAT